MFSAVDDVLRWEENGLAFVAVIKDDSDADTSYLEQPHNRKRLRAYKRGDFSFCGVMVRAFALPDVDEKEVVGADSLWDIESDSGERYFTEVAHELAGEILAEINGQG